MIYSDDTLSCYILSVICVGLTVLYCIQIKTFIPILILGLIVLIIIILTAIIKIILWSRLRGRYASGEVTAWDVRKYFDKINETELHLKESDAQIFYEKLGHSFTIGKESEITIIQPKILYQWLQKENINLLINGFKNNITEDDLATYLNGTSEEKQKIFFLLVL